MSPPRGYLQRCPDCRKAIGPVDTAAERDAAPLCDDCKACSQCGKVFEPGDRRSRWDDGSGLLTLCAPSCVEDHFKS